jgi:phosphatidate cytidylyltransferase
VSAAVTGALTIWIIIDGGFWLYVEIILCLLGLLWEWYRINHNRRGTWLFAGGIIYIALPMLFWLWAASSRQESMIRSVLWLLAIVCPCDIFAFFGGRLLGGAKLAPKISPNKTWSGVVVGSIGASITSVSYLFIRDVEMSGVLMVTSSIVLVIAAVLGDLLESKIKRILMVKDMGSVIPGHGGMCDRLDSFLLASYAFIIMDYALRMGLIFG